MQDYSKEKSFPKTYTLIIPTEGVLRFNSSFESGNLRKAVKLGEDEYNLILENDTNTQGNTQWYYFSVTNYKAGHTVKFSIINLLKFESLYNKGLKPLVYSTKKAQDTGKTWERTCGEVSYFKNSYSEGEKSLYTLSFSYTFEHAEDTVYFAHSYPYTYSELIQQLQSYSSQKNICRVDNLCYTLGGNSCPILTITSQMSTYYTAAQEAIKLEKSGGGRRMIRMKERKREEHKKKKGVVLTARVHPGETVGSLMMKGAIEFLLGETRMARYLRKNFVFKIVPMLNPDGVVYGNYRTSLLGIDLNRRWINPNKVLHPTIYYTKKVTQVLGEEREIVMFCDMHGHSIKKNVFFYGCRQKGTFLENIRSNIITKMIPVLLAHKNRILNFNDCKFRMEKSKESTARIVIYKQLGILCSYTLEASFLGPSHQSALENRKPEPEETPQNVHMQKHHYMSVGRDLCKLLVCFVNPRIFRNRLQFVISFFNCDKKTAVTQMKKENLVTEESDFGEDFEEDLEYSEKSVDLSKELKGFDFNQIVDESDSDSGGSEDSNSDEEVIEVKPKTNKNQTPTSKYFKKIIKPFEKVSSPEFSTLKANAQNSAKSTTPLSRPKVLEKPRDFSEDSSRKPPKVSQFYRLQYSKKPQTRNLTPIKPTIHMETTFQDHRNASPQIKVTQVSGGFKVNFKKEREFNSFNTFLIKSYERSEDRPTSRDFVKKKESSIGAPHRIFKRFIR